MQSVRAGLLLAAMTLVCGQAMAQDADPVNGEKVFKRCAACHTIEPGKKKIGPSLHGVVGREAGVVEGFKYSDAMLESGIVWDEEILSSYLENPKEVVPKGKMVFAGLKKEQERLDVIAYLKSVSEE